MAPAVMLDVEEVRSSILLAPTREIAGQALLVLTGSARYALGPQRGRALCCDRRFDALRAVGGRVDDHPGWPHGVRRREICGSWAPGRHPGGPRPSRPAHRQF